jgi:glutathione S-transferase
VHQNQTDPANVEMGLEALEALAARTAGRHIIGDDVTMAECFLVPQLDNARRHRVPVTPARFPTLLRCEAAVAARAGGMSNRPLTLYNP